MLMYLAHTTTTCCKRYPHTVHSVMVRVKEIMILKIIYNQIIVISVTCRCGRLVNDHLTPEFRSKQLLFHHKNAGK